MSKRTGESTGSTHREEMAPMMASLAFRTAEPHKWASMERLEAANATAEGICSAGSEADPIAAQGFDNAQLTGHDALIVAGPCWAGSAGRPILAKPIDRALAALTTDDL